VIERYLHENGVHVTPEHGVDNLAMAVSLVASTRGLALMPEYATSLLPWSVVSRPLECDAPTVDLVMGYSVTNSSPVLKQFLSKAEEVMAQFTT
jgi:LysR family transcriptional regulator, hca operon transcriptional activator